MNNACKACKGACCKTVIIPLTISPHLDAEWLAARGRITPDGQWVLETHCKHLDQQGRCKIYETRPRSCREYTVNGKSCLLTRQC
jgi:Fe-S-cluster containining protein